MGHMIWPDTYYIFQSRLIFQFLGGQIQVKVKGLGSKLTSSVLETIKIIMISIIYPDSDNIRVFLIRPDSSRVLYRSGIGPIPRIVREISGFIPIIFEGNKKKSRKMDNSVNTSRTRILRHLQLS